jgi:hypothetical protein
MPNDPELQTFAALLKSDIFPSKKRPPYSDFFTLLHYPNHLTSSLRNVRYSWKKRAENDTYGMIFEINEVEIIKSRNRNKRPCSQNGNDYDDVVRRKHSEKVGCRAPYQDPNIETKICTTMQEIEKAKFELRFDEYGNIPPCKTMEKISYSYKEIEYSNTKWENNGTFWISIRIRNPKFKEIVQIR